jgi:hypothetical protein
MITPDGTNSQHFTFTAARIEEGKAFRPFAGRKNT